MLSSVATRLCGFLRPFAAKGTFGSKRYNAAKRAEALHEPQPV